MNTKTLAPRLSSRRTLHVLAAGLGLLSLSALTIPLVRADGISLNIHVEDAPPPPRREVVVESHRPGPDYVWVGGYWDGAPGRYTWVNGHWDRPPHGHARWFAPHWERDHDGHFHQIRGEWR
jgi:WXXGXW repeat (2 copies)